MSTYEQLVCGLSDTPDDWELRGVLADWAEDQDRPHLSECLHWMIRHRKRPYHGASFTATWFNADTISTGLGDPESDIPEAVYRYLKGGKETANHKTFVSRRAAEESFHQAWTEAREHGWHPEEAPVRSHPPRDPIEHRGKPG